MNEVVENSLDPELWHACAGAIVQVPPVNSKVFYFPQGHAEHALTNVDFGALRRIPAMILCRVASVKYLADPETDEVYAKIRLVPAGNSESAFDDDGVLGCIRSEPNGKPTSFTKALTQSDANQGGGFSVPRYCAETIFPRLDYKAKPPVQNVIAKDVHGETWKFRHIFRGTPKRHLLTTGWSNFVNQKKLVTGDSVVFLRSQNGDLCVGIRRAKRGGGGISGNYSSSVWTSGSAINSVGDENRLMRRSTSNVRGRGRVRPESVVEAVFSAVNGQPFEVVYYPRASTPEFCVKASSVNAAMRIQWCPGMKFKMAFETEDSSRVSWFMGTIASVQVADSVHWPTSPWRMLQVTWDEPELLQNVKCVSPWLVEMVSNVPIVHLPPLSPPRKKLCLPQYPPGFSIDGQFPMPSFSGTPLGPISPLSAGIQGARHNAQIGVVPLSDLHLSNQLQTGPSPPQLIRLASQSKSYDRTAGRQTDSNENASCLLSIGISSQSVKKPVFILFGQPILTEQEMSLKHACDEVSKLALGNLAKNLSATQFSDTGNFQVFLE